MGKAVDKQEFYAYLKSMVGLAVNDNTCFFDDVGIGGRDAEQMMVQISERYGVDMNGYEPNHFHSNEAEIANIFLHLWHKIKGAIPHRSSFTALHLYNVVNAGHWFPPPLAQECS